MSKTLSIIPAPFSNCIEYEKPEHPPPTTPTRRPAGTGLCCAIISFTFATAFEVKLTGGFLGVTSGTVVGTVVVAIGISLNCYPLIITKPGFQARQKPRSGPSLTLYWMIQSRPQSRPENKTCQCLPYGHIICLWGPLTDSVVAHNQIGKASGSFQDQHR